MHMLTSSQVISYVRQIVLTKVKIFYIKYKNFIPKKENLIFLGREKKPKNPIVFLKKRNLTWFKHSLNLF